MTEPRLCRLVSGCECGVNPSRLSAAARSQCGRTHAACSSTRRTGSQASKRSPVQGGSERISSGSKALRTPDGSSEAA